MEPVGKVKYTLKINLACAEGNEKKTFHVKNQNFFSYRGLQGKAVM